MREPLRIISAQDQGTYDRQAARERVIDATIEGSSGVLGNLIYGTQSESDKVHDWTDTEMMLMRCRLRSLADSAAHRRKDL